jgi:mannose-6-phosphate isomerase-like protein (cupin superfamily)
MKIKRLLSHPKFRLEGESDHFQSCWEFELFPGEETSPHRHYEREELLYLVSGKALVTVEATQREVTTGEVVLIPSRHSHKIRNRSNRVLRALSVESRYEDVESFFAEPEESLPLDSLESAVQELPKDLNVSEAIAKLVEIFNLGSRLSEHIERSLNVDEPDGQQAMGQLERQVMDAVLRITKRYGDPR